MTVDLEWTNKLFVVGPLESLNTEPYSGNIIGARRAVSTFANALECKSWLRKEEGALANPFELFWDEEDSSSEDESD